MGRPPLAQVTTAQRALAAIRCKKHRERHNLTQTRMAEIAGTNTTQICMVEGQNAGASTRVVAAILRLCLPDAISLDHE